MSRQRLLVVILLALCAPLSPGCLATSKVDPEPIPVASSLERTEGAIREALRREGWAIETLSVGEVYARTEIAALTFPLRSRIVFDDSVVSIAWAEDVDPVGESPQETADRRKAIRRHLRSLSDRVSYFIQSADLRVEDPAPASSEAAAEPTPGR